MPEMSFIDTVRARRSFRAFAPQRVPDDVIRHVLDDAQHTPSNCNTQPWNVHIVSGSKRDALSGALHAANSSGATSPDFSWDEAEFVGRHGERRREHGRLYYEMLGVQRDDREARLRASAADFSFFGAPHVALLFVPVFGDCVRVASDLGMYAQTFLLSLTAHGLAGVPQTVIGLHADTVRETLHISAELKLLFAISFGYAAPDAAQNQKRVGRDPISDNVTFHDGEK